MKGDARWILNKKKGITPHKQEIWKSHGSVDARSILNIKRINKPKPPVYGSYMRTNTAKSVLIASQIKKEIFSSPKEPNENKSIQLSNDGNIIISRNIFQMHKSSIDGSSIRSRNVENSVIQNRSAPKIQNNWIQTMHKSSIDGSSIHSKNTENSVIQNRSTPKIPDNWFQTRHKKFQSSSCMDDLEHTSIADVVDFESLPQSYVDSKSLQSANLSRNSAMSQILGREDTMIADKFSSYKRSPNKVFVSNLHSTVSRRDVMELFSDVGVVRSIEMGMPGTAVIEYFDEGDAVKACDIYQNRLLDGLPMKCYLQNSCTPQKFALSQRLGSRMQPRYEPVDTPFSPIVFNARSRYNPHNVQFTVKLT